jgi:ATP-binding cassette subfamily B protein/subfamily B ATP-binding cassette protein MsbA
MAVAEQTLTALPVVQAFAREHDETERFTTLGGSAAVAYGRTITAQQRFAVGTGGITALGTAAMMGVGGLHVLQGSLSVGSLVVLLTYLSSLYAPLQTLTSVSAGLASAGARARRVMEVLGSEERVRERPGARSLVARAGGHVRFERVTFGYAPARPVLHDVSLEVQPGETLALVGPSGAGKSTLVSLVLRFFDPWVGRVTLDGHDLRDLRLASLRGQVALVLQEPFLLPLSVADNIAYGRPTASRAEVEAAAVAANADAFIRRLPAGYDTPLGERGAALSGGERQRLAIARALLKDAPVLILDEPTAALDAGSEALLLEALDRLLVGRTTLIIAHRLSTIRRADRVAVLDGGRLVELGTPTALLAADGPYRHLHQLQVAALASPAQVPT